MAVLHLPFFDLMESHTAATFLTTSFVMGSGMVWAVFYDSNRKIDPETQKKNAAPEIGELHIGSQAGEVNTNQEEQK